MDPSPAWGWILRTPRENGGTSQEPSQSHPGRPQSGTPLSGSEGSLGPLDVGEKGLESAEGRPRGKQKNCVAILEAKGQGICCVELL